MATWDDISKGQVLENISAMEEKGLVRLELPSATDRLLLALPYDEEEIDRRLEVLERAGTDPGVLAELKAFHAQRRRVKDEE